MLLNYEVINMLKHKQGDLYMREKKERKKNKTESNIYDVLAIAIFFKNKF